MSDDRLVKAAARGRQFREWCEGPDGLYAVFDAVERNYSATLYKTEATEADLREKIYHRVNALRDLRKVMEAAIVDGKGADAMVKALTEAQAKARKRAVKA